MKYLQYNPTIYIGTASELPSDNMPFVIPSYTNEEYSAHLRAFKALPKDNYALIYNDGNLSDRGKYIFNNMGFKYCTYPYITTFASYPKNPFNAITSNIKLYDLTETFKKMPDTSTNRKDFRLFDKKAGYLSCHVTTYEPRTNGNYIVLGVSSGGSLFGGSYGDGTGNPSSSQNPNTAYSALNLLFFVDNALYKLEIAGYYSYSPTPYRGNLPENPTNYTDIVEFLSTASNIPVDPTITDPYNKGDSSSIGGGGGTFGGGNTIFGGTSDSVDIPPLPTASASSAGFITLFNPSLAQLNNLANYMWSDLFSLDTFKKIFADPMDCILGLSIVPVKPASAGTSAVKIGNVSTDVSMNKTSSQYVAVDCGTIDVKEYWGAYLDYAPYTQCEIYLPYVGTKQISVDDVMNKAVHVVYHVDILSGACNAYVKCGDSVLYTFVGQCSSSIPISGNDWTNVLNGAISVAGKIGLAMATGGATALMSGLGAASSIISSSKPTVERSGAMSSTGGLLGIQKPYLILTRPKQALPENQNKYTGYPSFITMALSDCTGYTEIDSVHLENMSCTDEEAQEIENLLKSGVIF